ncbi:MAG TPA: RloB family protein [Bryobacteraceae bacterium]
MSLLSRQVRPLGRDPQQENLRDSRLFLIACDDRYAPKQYFDFFRLTRIKIVVDPTEDTKSDPRHVLERLRKRRDKEQLQPDDECWLVLDTDHNIEPNHRPNLITTIRDAQKDGIQVALSFPCFELWLLLHHIDEEHVKSLGKCGDVESTIRSYVGEYNKTNLKPAHYGDGSASDATLRAERLDQTVTSGDIPNSPTTRIYRLIRAIVSKGVPSDLPLELRHLIPNP